MKKIICLLAFCVFVAGCVQNNDDKPATEIEIGVVLASVGDGGDGEVIATPAEVLTEDGVEYGTQVELTAPAAAEGYVFDGWSGDVLSMDNPLVFTIEADTVRLTANYAFLHKVSASVGAGGDGMIVATPAEALTSGVRYGTEIELTAPAAEEGYVFYSWFGDISSTDNPLVFTIEEDVTTLRANYRQEYVVCPAGEVAIELSDGIVIWAGSNLSGYQTFAQNPEDFGCLFHWGYKGVIAGADDTLSGEMLYSSIPDITTWPAGEDPCPLGWRLPTERELADLIGAQNYMGNPDGPYTSVSWITGTGAGTGFVVTPKAGDTAKTLYLPNAGCRLWQDSGRADNLGEKGFYWSSVRGSILSGIQCSYGLSFSQSQPAGFTRDVFAEHDAYSVRCVS